MRKPLKTLTPADIRRKKKRIQQRMDALDKQFDLGFITEKEFLTKSKNAVKRGVELALTDSERILKKLNGIIRRRKFYLTRTKQDFMLLLTSKYATKEIKERWEIAINDGEEELQEFVKIRENTREQKKMQEGMLIRIANLRNSD